MPYPCGEQQHEDQDAEDYCYVEDDVCLGRGRGRGVGGYGRARDELSGGWVDDVDRAGYDSGNDAEECEEGFGEGLRGHFVVVVD